MGAVKTNRRTKSIDWKYYINKSFLKQHNKFFKRLYQSLRDDMPWRGQNNRRKMAGLPLIRRAKS